MVARLTEAEFATLQAGAGKGCRITVSKPAPQPVTAAPASRRSVSRKPAPVGRTKRRIAPAAHPLPLRIVANIVAAIGTGAVVIVASFAVTIATLGVLRLVL